LILSGSKRTHAIQTAVVPLVSLFATIFFVLIGTSMDLSVINPADPANRSGLVIAAFLVRGGPFSASWRRAGAS